MENQNQLQDNYKKQYLLASVLIGIVTVLSWYLLKHFNVKMSSNEYRYIQQLVFEKP